jgi:anti-sigma factor RsiW
MECIEVQNLLSEYSVGLIEGSRRAAIEQHLSVCPECRVELQKLNDVMLLVDGLDEVEPPAGLWNGVYNRITEPEPRMGTWERIGGWLQGQRRTWSVGLATAALAIAILASHVNHPGVEKSFAAQEYIQGHAIYATQDPLADQAALNTVAAVAYRDQVGDHM